MSKQQEDLINNVLDEGLHNFVNKNQPQFINQNLKSNNNEKDYNNLSNNTYLMNQNNNNINNKELYYTSNNNNNDCNNEINDKNESNDKIHQYTKSFVYDKNYIQNLNKYEDNYYNLPNNENNYNYSKMNYSERKTAMLADPEYLQRLDDNNNFISNLRNITLYPKISKTLDTITGKKEIDLNQITKKIINKEEKRTNINFGNQFYKDYDIINKPSIQKVKKCKSNNFFYQSKAMFEKKKDKKEEKDNENDIDNDNTENIQIPISDENNFELYMEKQNKEVAENEIWKEKFDVDNAEYENLMQLLEEERNKNKLIQNDINRVKNKAKKLPDLQDLNEKLIETKENLEKELQQTEKIKEKQIELISKLQNEINEMRKILRKKTPF